MTALVIVGALIYSFYQTPMYSSQAKVLVEAINISQTQVAPQPNIETEKQLVDSAAVAALVIRDLHLTVTTEQVLENLSVSAPPGTEILLITYQDPNPREAQRRAQAFARDYLDLRRQRFEHDLSALTDHIARQIRDLQNELQRLNTLILASNDPIKRAALTDRASSLVTQIGLLQQRRSDLTPAGALYVGEIEDPADLPTSPMNRRYILTGGLALFLGLALGIGIALARDRLDDHLRTEGDLEVSLGAPTLAAIPRLSRKAVKRGPLIDVSDVKSSVADAYRSLRTAVLFATAQRQAKVLVVTSPESGNGKTTVAANLGAAIAQFGKRVVLVNADLRRPRLDGIFPLTGQLGLTNVLMGEVNVQDALRSTPMPKLSVIGTGPLQSGNVELLGSELMKRVLDELARKADIVLVDAPPTLGSADALAVAGVVGSVLLVVDAKRTTKGAIERARRQLELVNVTPLGGVLNNFDPSNFRPYYLRAEDYGWS